MSAPVAVGLAVTAMTTAYSYQTQKQAGRAAQQRARYQAQLQKEQAEEQARRLHRQQQKNMAALRVAQAVSGVGGYTDLIVQSARQAEYDRELEWLRRAGYSQQQLTLQAGRDAADQANAAAIGSVLGGLGSAVEWWGRPEGTP